MSENGDRPHNYGRHTDFEPGEEPRRKRRRRQDDEFRPYRGEQYYDLPVVKPSPWGWLIISYFFIGGLAGASQMIAAIADLFGGPTQRPVVRTGRYLAFMGTLISPVLLILDLHTPARWYNMLRIMRRTSPMSIGSWMLGAFGAASGIAAVTQLLRETTGTTRFSTVERAAGLAGAATGAAMATYTATLLSSTSTPLWLTASRQLPILFGSTATASAIAAIDVTLAMTPSHAAHRRPLSILALVAAAIQWWSARAMEQSWMESGVEVPGKDRPLHMVDMILVKGAGIYTPMLAHSLALVSGRAPGPLGPITSLATLIGSFAERWLIVNAGNRSADIPADYFVISQPAGDGEAETH